MFLSSKANHTIRSLQRPTAGDTRRRSILRRTYCLAFALILAALMTADVLAAPADLDASFGNGGKVTTNSTSRSEEAHAVVIQPDGKIVVAGYLYSDGTYNFMVGRYNPDGTPDTSFGTAGFADIPVLSGDDYAYAVALQPDGKIVVAGQAANGSSSDFALVRVNTDGSPDTTFDTDGKVTTPVLNSYDIAFAVAVQPDGKIVAAGSAAVNNSDYDFALVRYNANGSLDTSFDTDGKVTTSFAGIDEAYAVAIQPDGKIVAVGYDSDEAGLDFSLARYNANGSLDTSFDGDGKVTTAIQESSDQAYAVAIQPDGKIVVAGQAFTNGVLGFALARYQVNGSLDTSFDTDGKAFTSILGSNDGAYAVAVQPDGRIVLAGSAGTGTEFDFAAARFNKNGALDTSFDSDGKLTTKFTNDFDGAFGAAIQPDGRIVAAGYATNNSVRNLALARYMGDPRPNRTANFDADGKTDISDWNPANGFWYVLNSSTNMPRTPVQWGNGTFGDKAVPGDYDGDGKTDIAVWRESTGVWYILRSSNNTTQVISWGQSGDKPVQGDYDADGKTDVAIFRPSTGAWYVLRSSDNSLSGKAWGANGDQPVPADYDGDGATDIAVWRASNGYWYIITSRDSFVRLNSWGKSGDKAVAADYDGDGRADTAVFRPSDGKWYIRLWSGSVVAKSWGNASDVPVAADYDGDGRADIAVYRASESGWYINQSANGTARYENLGQPGVPVASQP